MARPSKYKKKYCNEVISLMAEGTLDFQICAKWGISRDTFYRWQREYPEFKEAVQIGLCACESALLEKRIKGNIDFKTWIALMNKKFNYNGTEGKEHSSSNTINIENMNVLEMSQDEINKKLENLMEKYGTTNLEELKQKALINDRNTE